MLWNCSYYILLPFGQSALTIIKRVLKIESQFLISSSTHAHLYVSAFPIHNYTRHLNFTYTVNYTITGTNSTQQKSDKVSLTIISNTHNLCFIQSVSSTIGAVYHPELQLGHVIPVECCDNFKSYYEWSISTQKATRKTTNKVSQARDFVRFNRKT